jgi:uncharacterized protein YndB with AHSA1/START domain
MEATQVHDSATVNDQSTAERTSDRELTVTRIVNGPARLVFEAWTKAELFERWWTPKSFPISLRSCEIDARVGGRYRLEFEHEGSTFEFFGRYLEVTPPSRLVWTNDEEHGGGTVTTVTFDEVDGRTRVVVHDRYPSKEALDAEIAAGSTAITAMPESLAQLDELLGELGSSANQA